jgi:hypothetical protein
MPRFDGTGPQGQGPLTGRGEGYCTVTPPEEPEQSAYGYAGLQGKPMQMIPRFGTRFARWLRWIWPGRLFSRGRGFGRGVGRGRGRGRW